MNQSVVLNTAQDMNPEDKIVFVVNIDLERIDLSDIDRKLDEACRFDLPVC